MFPDKPPASGTTALLPGESFKNRNIVLFLEQYARFYGIFKLLKAEWDPAEMTLILNAAHLMFFPQREFLTIFYLHFMLSKEK